MCARGPTGAAGWVVRTTALRRDRGGALAQTRASRETPGIGCLIALLALISPRLALILLWIFSDLLSRAFDSWLIPLLGFFVLPWTTLTYAAFWDWGSGRHVTGFEWFFVILAFVIDLGAYTQGRRAQTARVAD